VAVEDIFKALDEQAERDCEALMAHARSQADRIRAESQHEAARVREARLDQVRRELSLMRNKRLNEARLDGKKQASAQREQLIQSVFEGAAQKAAALREPADWPDRFERLLSEALGAVPRSDVTVHVDPRDLPLAESLVAKLAPGARVEADLTTMGGCTVVASGDKISRLNTIESRLAKARRVGKYDVAGALFGA
jgi:vacuolar-type H+-ATPase subunit E/Vma4